MNEENDSFIEPLHEQEESRLKRFFKRAYIILLALFLVMLLLVNTNTGYHLLSVISGKIASSTLNENYEFELRGGIKVIFQKEIFEELRTLYQNNQKNEFKVCLTGNKQNSDYVVEGAYVPEIYKQDVYSVTSQICNNETIISLHSHPPMRCIFSEQDLKSYESFRRINPDGIIALMCGEERMNFFGYKQ
ncbi:hypothetical protein JXC34_06985 [Candidatus Woesearchaeota archaeon]|nr:hypothetical protein [Candidatus Woesearchaeota archaeon]